MANDKSRLEEISIRSLGVIENSTLEFGPGLNVLTGETGAGKTMILTAIGLVLGGKSDASLVRHGSGRAAISATFSVSEDPVFEDYCEDGALILQRTVSEDGKSKAMAGGTTVPASLLAEMTAPLIEIHGQGANHNLSKPSKQRDMLDAFGWDEVVTALERYTQLFSRYLEISKQVEALKSSSRDRAKRILELEEFLKAGNSVKPKSGEATSIDGELSRLSSVEELRTATEVALTSLDSEESGAYGLLVTAQRSLESVAAKDSTLKEIAENLTESTLIAKDVLSALHRYSQGLEADPARLEALHNRKSDLVAFLRKFSNLTFSDESIDGVIESLKAARVELTNLSGGDERVSELGKEMADLRIDVIEAAASLSRSRTKAAEELSRRVSTEIQSLAMPHMCFQVAVTSPDYSAALKDSDFTIHGCDDVEMSIQSQSDGPFLPIMKSASGGELSRIMLALEVVLAETSPVGTYIFDEVDAGVGGKAAIEVGRRLAQLAEKSQVIVVTHLPQVAAWATSHFTVEKESDGRVVSSGVRHIEGEARIEEIARMLAGLGESASAREHAAELLALRSSLH